MSSGIAVHTFKPPRLSAPLPLVLLAGTTVCVTVNATPTPTDTPTPAATDTSTPTATGAPRGVPCMHCAAVCMLSRMPACLNSVLPCTHINPCSMDAGWRDNRPLAAGLCLDSSMMAVAVGCSRVPKCIASNNWHTRNAWEPNPHMRCSFTCRHTHSHANRHVHAS